MKRRKNIFLYFFTELKNLPSLLFLSTNITLSTLLILAVCRKLGQRLMQSHVKHGLLRNCFLPCHATLREKLRDISKNEWAWSLCGSEHRSAESEGLRLDSSGGTQNFLFFPRSSFFNLSLLQYYLGKELRFFLSASLKKTSQGSVLSWDLPLSLF